MSIAETTWIRGISMLIPNLLICQAKGYDITFKAKHDYRLLSIRSLVMCTHTFTMAFSQFILPLPIVHTVACSGTLMIFIIDYLKNGVVINKYQIIGVGVGLVGVLLSTNGGLIMKIFDPSYEQSTEF